jgi:hypothetical protein
MTDKKKDPTTDILSPTHAYLEAHKAISEKKKKIPGQEAEIVESAERKWCEELSRSCAL